MTPTLDTSVILEDICILEPDICLCLKMLYQFLVTLHFLMKFLDYRNSSDYPNAFCPIAIILQKHLVINKNYCLKKNRDSAETRIVVNNFIHRERKMQNVNIFSPTERNMP